MNRFMTIFLALVMSTGCSPKLESNETVEDDQQVDIGNNDTTEEEEAQGSDIHGGSPANVTWNDCGGMIDDHPCDFSLVDQYGDTFTLYDNYGKLIVLDFSTMWCSVCNNIAHDAQVFMDDYGNQNFLWVTVLIDANAYGVAPSEQDVIDWANLYGIDDAPVVAGNRSLIDLTAESGWPVSSWPTLVILDRTMIIKYGINGWNESTIRGWVETEL